MQVACYTRDYENFYYGEGLRGKKGTRGGGDTKVVRVYRRLPE